MFDRNKTANGLKLEKGLVRCLCVRFPHFGKDMRRENPDLHITQRDNQCLANACILSIEMHLVDHNLERKGR